MSLYDTVFIKYVLNSSVLMAFITFWCISPLEKSSRLNLNLLPDPLISRINCTRPMPGSSAAYWASPFALPKLSANWPPWDSNTSMIYPQLLIDPNNQKALVHRFGHSVNLIWDTCTLYPDADLYDETTIPGALQGPLDQCPGCDDELLVSYHGYIRWVGEAEPAESIKSYWQYLQQPGGKHSKEIGSARRHPLSLLTLLVLTSKEHTVGLVHQDEHTSLVLRIIRGIHT